MRQPSIRLRALELRKEGYSYNLIKEMLGCDIAKSTLSSWLAGVPYLPNEATLSRIGKARTLSGLAKHKIRQASYERAEKESKLLIKDMSKRDRFMFGLGLYAGEGAKTHDSVRMINANPEIISFTVKWFKESFGLETENFTIRLHLYPDNDERECLKYWSAKSGIPRNLFHKVQVDRREDKKRSKVGKLPYGTAHLIVKSGGEKDFGVYLARKIHALNARILQD